MTLLNFLRRERSQNWIPVLSQKAPQIFGTQLGEVVRPPRIELGLRVPETLVISFSLRAHLVDLTQVLSFLSTGVYRRVTTHVTRHCGVDGRIQPCRCQRAVPGWYPF